MSTRERLQETALRLFVERGYDEVTVEEIAAAAGFSHMTFFRHFPTKESVVLDDPYDPVIGRFVAATDPSLPAIERVVAGLSSAWAHVDEPEDRETRVRIGLAVDTPRLRARIWENNQRTGELIVEALVDTGTAPFDAEVAAGAALGAITAALLRWGADETEDTLGDVVRRSLEVLGVAP